VCGVLNALLHRLKFPVFAIKILKNFVVDVLFRGSLVACPKAALSPRLAASRFALLYVVYFSWRFCLKINEARKAAAVCW
jgi:hypothetical protein